MKADYFLHQGRKEREGFGGLKVERVVPTRSTFKMIRGFA
jgi:hypothetical protein